MSKNKPFSKTQSPPWCHINSLSCQIEHYDFQGYCKNYNVGTSCHYFVITSVAYFLFICGTINFNIEDLECARICVQCRG